MNQYSFCCTGHLRRRKTKSGNTWQIVIEHGEDPATGNRKRTYHTFNGTKTNAQKKMQSLLDDLNRGLYIDPSKVLLSEYLRDWLITYAEPNLAPSTVAGYKVNIENHIIPLLGNIPFQKLQPMQVQKAYTYLSNKPIRSGKTGLSPRSIRYIHTTLREALQHAVKMQLVDRNIADLATPPRMRKFRATVLEEQQILDLLEKAKTDPEMEIAILLLVGLGLRRGELLALFFLHSFSVFFSYFFFFSDFQKG